MPNNKQNRTKGLRAFTKEEIQMLKAHQAEHEKKMETDPEYRKLWEKKKKIFEETSLFNDSVPE